MVIEMIRTEDKEKLVYVDETGIDTYLYRERARAPRGAENHRLCLLTKIRKAIDSCSKMWIWHCSDTMELAIQSCSIFG